MGLVVVKDIETLQRIADRERSPMYQVGYRRSPFTFKSKKTLVLNRWIFALEDFFDSPKSCNAI
jgi:phosphoribosylformylglycinamidine synthase